VLADSLPGGVTFIPGANGAQVNGNTVSFSLGDVGPGGSGSISFQVQIGNNVSPGTQITNQGQLNSPDLSQPVPSNPVTTTVVAAVTSFAGTWFAFSQTDPSVSLTVDPQNRFTVWAFTPDGQTVTRAAQGHVKADGSFDVFSSDQLVHFTGQIAADRQSAAITAARSGFVPFTVTAPRLQDVDPTPLPNYLVGTFNGTGAANDGSSLTVRMSIDPGGNATFEDEAVPVNTVTRRLQFAHFYVTLAPDGRGRVLDPNGNQPIQVGTLQVQNNVLVLTYNFSQGGSSPYQNQFQVQLQPLP
jgi:hypothetical protein